MSLSSSLYTGTSGLKNMGNGMQVVGNNIANTNTVGFKSGRSTFSDTLYENVATQAGTAQMMPYYGIPVDVTSENVGMGYNREILTGLPPYTGDQGDLIDVAAQAKLEPALAEDESSRSCAWTTLHAVLALTEYPEQRRNMEVRRGAVFLLDRMFKRNSLDRTDLANIMRNVRKMPNVNRVSRDTTKPKERRTT